eukprot:NODE_100_length_20331_cov_1.214462.p11 type:complete len:306 gc:universal NODE_100_length_20331_cov_1.214462:14890-15807(+)
MSSANASREESSSAMIDITELGKHGINAADIAKLKNAGVCTIKGLQMTARKNLLKVKGLSDTKVDKMKEAAGKICSSGFMSAQDLEKQRESVVKISTGSKEFDKLLGGGIETQSITEVHGEFRCGKTQLAHTLCVTCQLSTDDHPGGKAAVIDTEGTFRPEKLRAIAERFEMDPDEVTENVIYARAFNSEHQMELLTELAATFAQDKTFRLLVVDSIIALFRTDYSGRGELADRQQKLNGFLANLQRIAEEFNVAVYITNQMMSDPGGMSFGPDKKAVGGHVLAHAAATRIALRKGRGDSRMAKM